METTMLRAVALGPLVPTIAAAPIAETITQHFRLTGLGFDVLGGFFN